MFRQSTFKPEQLHEMPSGKSFKQRINYRLGYYLAYDLPVYPLPAAIVSALSLDKGKHRAEKYLEEFNEHAFEIAEKVKGGVLRVPVNTPDDYLSVMKVFEDVTEFFTEGKLGSSWKLRMHLMSGLCEYLDVNQGEMTDSMQETQNMLVSLPGYSGSDDAVVNAVLGVARRYLAAGLVRKNYAHYPADAGVSISERQIGVIDVHDDLEKISEGRLGVSLLAPLMTDEGENLDVSAAFKRIRNSINQYILDWQRKNDRFTLFAGTTGITRAHEYAGSLKDLIMKDKKNALLVKVYKDCSNHDQAGPLGSSYKLRDYLIGALLEYFGVTEQERKYLASQAVLALAAASYAASPGTVEYMQHKVELEHVKGLMVRRGVLNAPWENADEIEMRVINKNRR